MAYYTKVLQPGEAVRYLGHLHWLIYGRVLPFLILAIVFAVVSVGAADPGQSTLRNICAATAFGCIVIGLLLSIGSFIRRRTTEIVVTDRRVLFKTGLISRHTLEMNITKIETVDVDQPIIGRLFGYGTVSVRGTGAGMEPMRRVAHPLELRNSILVG